MLENQKKPLKRVFIKNTVYKRLLQLWFNTVERKTDVAVAESVIQVAVASSQTDEDFASREHRFRTSFRELLYQLLTHTVHIKRGNLIDTLMTRNVLSHGEKQRLKEQKRTDVKVNTLLMMLREKSSDQFESFLTTLSETGQQSVADVVRQALHSVGLTGDNPLHSFDGKIVCTIYPYSYAPTFRNDRRGEISHPVSVFPSLTPSPPSSPVVPALFPPSPPSPDPPSTAVFPLFYTSLLLFLVPVPLKYSSFTNAP